ncbi:MAG TPA: sugar phosphate nucleotidyltransferase [Acidimicrobiales bacterium]|jgi:CTP:molybdopterin cytidylyltransferase MocA|nr:sugar phosphate nucleotidyltransferase [Acidimicrobiales bacterium]
MADSIAGVVLAAGAGVRLRPLTRLRPKVLCPVGDRALVDHALDRFAGVTASIAVNVHHHRDMLESHLAGRVHLSIEEPVALGTAGALGRLREWIDGRPVIALNGDTYCPATVQPLLDGWDGTRLRVFVVGAGPLRAGSVVAGSLLPWSEVVTFAPEPTGLYERSWGRAAQDGRLEVVPLPADAMCIDCGSPADYLAANLAWSGGESVIGRGALVEGTLDQSVVWPGAPVRAGEHLVHAIRANDRVTVLVR